MIESYGTNKSAGKSEAGMEHWYLNHKYPVLNPNFNVIHFEKYSYYEVLILSPYLYFIPSKFVTITFDIGQRIANPGKPRTSIHIRGARSKYHMPGKPYFL